VKDVPILPQSYSAARLACLSAVFMAGLIPNPQLIVQVYPARLVEPGSPREIYSCNS